MDFQMKIMVKFNSTLMINLKISTDTQNTYVQTTKKKQQQIIIKITVQEKDAHEYNCTSDSVG
jgi:hypothetical protein